MADPQTFGQRLRVAMDAYGPLCVGIDPHRGLVESWGLTYDVEGLARFADACVEAFAGQVAVVKPQSAFFEVFGSAGLAVLERTIAAFEDTGTQVIVDAKRGDIGSTMEAYAHAFLGKDSPLAGDAVTLSPFLGYGSLRPALDLAEQTFRGAFVLALTSNPEGFEVQHAVRADRTVAASLVEAVAADNADAPGDLGSVGLVVGATVGNAVHDLGLDLAGAKAPILAPGFGAQGGRVADLHTVFGDAMRNVIPSSSRGVLKAGPDPAALRAAASSDAAALR